MIETEAERVTSEEGLQADVKAAKGMFVISIINSGRLPAMLKDALAGDRLATKLLGPTVDLVNALSERRVSCVCCANRVRPHSEFLIVIATPATAEAANGVASAICEGCSVADNERLMGFVVRKMSKVWPGLHRASPEQQENLRGKINGLF